MTTKTVDDSILLSQPATANRRRLPDRRQKHRFVNWRHLGFQSRRRGHRRADGNAKPFVDFYEKTACYKVLAVVVLSCCDAFFTLRLLALGATELNTLMAVLIENNIRNFVVFKIALTGLALILLLIYKDFLVFKRFKVEQFINFILIGYSILIGYELLLLAYAYG